MSLFSRFKAWGSTNGLSQTASTKRLNLKSPILGSIRAPLRAPLKGTLLNPTYGFLNRDRIERVWIPKGPPSPNSYPQPYLLRLIVDGVTYTARSGVRPRGKLFPQVSYHNRDLQ